MKRPCVPNGDGIGKDRAIGVHLKPVAQPDHDEQDRPRDPSRHGAGAQNIDIRAAGDDVPRRMSNDGRARYAGSQSPLRTTTTATSPQAKHTEILQMNPKPVSMFAFPGPLARQTRGADCYSDLG